MRYLFAGFLASLSLLLSAQDAPLNDITQRQLIRDQRVLPLQDPDERDLFWERHLWRVIDVRQKINHPFVAPQRPFFELLCDLADQGSIQLYSSENDRFTLPLSGAERNGILHRKDTIEVILPDFTVTYKEISETIYYEDIKRFRVKEIWYFDSHLSEMRVRILGIAPLREVYDEAGHFLYEMPLFWVHYPSARPHLARYEVVTEANEAARTTWSDLWDRRQFDSYVYKHSNTLDLRLGDRYSGTDLLLEAQKAEAEVFNFEHDLWSY